MDFTVKNGFKVAVGAYIGWSIMKAVDSALVEILKPVAKLVSDKLNEVNDDADKEEGSE